jgi:homogentisate 1,2-dioxygenase
MPHYHRLGQVPRKRHSALRRPDGSVLHEQLIGSKGFTGPSSLLYHLRMPTRVTAVELLRALHLEPDPDPRLRPRHFFSERLGRGGSPTLDRATLLYNDDCSLSVVDADRADAHFYRNGEADELWLVVDGQGELESSFGALPLVPGDQVVVPRGLLTQLRWSSPSLRLLILESRGALRWPRRYCTEHGQLLEGAPFAERDLKLPQELRTHDETGEFELIVKQHGALHRVRLDHHPFDVVGWDGCYYPWAFSIHDFEPIVGRVHQPPPVHQFLQGDALVVCDFVPRPFDFGDDAIPAPYHHSNVMSDEVLYYASGAFMSRKGIERGSLTLHPDGLPHGPHPGRYEGSIGQPRTDELALMIDTFRPLRVARTALAVEDPDYLTSWVRGA